MEDWDFFVNSEQTEFPSPVLSSTTSTDPSPTVSPLFPATEMFELKDEFDLYCSTYTAVNPDGRSSFLTFPPPPPQSLENDETTTIEPTPVMTYSDPQQIQQNVVKTLDPVTIESPSPLLLPEPYLVVAQAAAASPPLPSSSSSTSGLPEPISPVIISASSRFSVAQPATPPRESAKAHLGPTPPRVARNDNRKKKASRLPDSAVDALKSWLVEKLDKPYPSKEEKTELSRRTGLSVSQVNNWFINARRRFVKPMLAARSAGINCKHAKFSRVMDDDDGDYDEYTE